MSIGTSIMSRSKVRAFQEADIAPVAELWSKAFVRRRTVAPETLRKYLGDVFLRNPWRSIGLDSLVHEDGEGRITGFLGVVPRWMRFMGRLITVAVASQLMVDHSKPSGFVAFEMLRTLFSGPQDLTFSDGANDLAQQMWVAAGGSIAMLYSSTWMRVLSPAQHVATQCSERRIGGPLGTPLTSMARPLCSAVDAAAVRIRQGPYWVESPKDLEEELGDEDLMWCIGHFSEDRSLQPEYDLESLRWLLVQSSHQRTHGALHKALIRRADGHTLGWYIFYAKPRAVGQVLQVGGKPGSIQRVLAHLFHRARSAGAVAISGQLEPSFARVLTQQHCGFSWIGAGLMHSRNTDLLNAIHRGDAFLSRLEGEWWMRFCDLREGA